MKKMKETEENNSSVSLFYDILLPRGKNEFNKKIYII